MSWKKKAPPQDLETHFQRVSWGLGRPPGVTIKSQKALMRIFEASYFGMIVNP